MSARKGSNKSATPTVTNQTLAGTYTPATFTTTDESLSVTQELIVAEHIFDFEATLSAVDLFEDRFRNTANALAAALDLYVFSQINTQAAGSTANFSVAGGFTSANVISSLATALGKVSGYLTPMDSAFICISDTDLPAFVQAQIANGFNMADLALRNGLLGNYMGLDIYLTRSTQYPANRRFFGIKNRVSFAMPIDWKFEEKEVSGKTGKEIVTYAYTGVKVWTPTLNLVGIINIT